MSEWLAETVEGGAEESVQLALEGGTRPIPTSAVVAVEYNRQTGCANSRKECRTNSIVVNAQKKAGFESHI
jgi:hypothetical protein